MKFISILFLCVIFGCKADPIIYPDGGYAFINTDTIKDKSFPYFPIRDSMNTRDSLNSILNESNILKLFHEPNISLKQSEKEIFRLKIDNWCKAIYYITLKDNKIIAKKGLQNKMFNWETNKLSESEQNLSYLLYMYMLYNDKDQEDRRKQSYTVVQKRQIDSCKKLGIPTCYKYLFEKTALPLSKTFKYETRIITLPYHTYKALIEKINNSGYWKMSLEADCPNASTDGDSYILEANSGKKYNYFRFGDCPDTSNKFTQACQEIINYAHYENEITIDYSNKQKR